jgi:hypothetical protein
VWDVFTSITYEFTYPAASLRSQGILVKGRIWYLILCRFGCIPCVQFIISVWNRNKKEETASSVNGLYPVFLNTLFNLINSVWTTVLYWLMSGPLPVFTQRSRTILKNLSSRRTTVLWPRTWLKWTHTRGYQPPAPPPAPEKGDWGQR